jgi:enoyl-CoA hydratase/carnithine racemase
MNDLILTNEDQHILTITLNRLDKKNALNSVMYHALYQQLSYANSNTEIHCVIIQGSEQCFSAGNDLQDFIDGFEAGDLAALNLISILVEFKKPLIAAVAGPAIGIGTTLLLHCDMVIAADNSVFKLPFTQLGLCPEAGSSLLLPQLVGSKKAFEFLVLGQSFGAQEALNIGLVNQICKEEHLLATVNDVANKITSLPIDALIASKSLLRQNNISLLKQTIASEVSMFTHLLKSDACKAILTRFFKR